LGTGNDLARVLGWGAAFDDDEAALSDFIDGIEKSKVQLLDRYTHTCEQVKEMCVNSTFCCSWSVYSSAATDAATTEATVNQSAASQQQSGIALLACAS
jgi:hypothetical protein